jgi:hypothetical protein
MNRMYLRIYDANLNLTRLVASARDDMMEEPEGILIGNQIGSVTMNKD